MQKFNFIGKLVANVSKEIGKPVTKEKVLNALIKGLTFLFLLFAAFLFVACFVFVCLTESNI